MAKDPNCSVFFSCDSMKAHIVSFNFLSIWWFELTNVAMVNDQNKTKITLNRPRAGCDRRIFRIRQDLIAPWIVDSIAGTCTEQISWDEGLLCFIGRHTVR